MKGIIHFTQPTIAPVFNTRQAQESLLNWAGSIPANENDPLADKGILSQKLEALLTISLLEATGKAF